MLIELGPLLELVAVLEDEEPGSWDLVVDDSTVIAVSYEQDRDSLVFEAEVGSLPDTGDSLAVVASLLAFNNAVEANHGIWMAFDGPESDTILQTMELTSVEALTLPRLQAALQILIERLSSWRQSLEPGGDAGSEGTFCKPALQRALTDGGPSGVTPIRV